MKTKKWTKAKKIAAYILQNVYYCPIVDNSNIPECEGFVRTSHKCIDCICKHRDDLCVNYDLFEEEK